MTDEAAPSLVPPQLKLTLQQFTYRLSTLLSQTLIPTDGTEKQYTHVRETAPIFAALERQDGSQLRSRRMLVQPALSGQTFLSRALSFLMLLTVQEINCECLSCRHR